LSLLDILNIYILSFKLIRSGIIFVKANFYPI